MDAISSVSNGLLVEIEEEETYAVDLNVRQTNRKAMDIFQHMQHKPSKPFDPGITIEIDPHFPEPEHPDPNDPTNWV